MREAMRSVPLESGNTYIVVTSMDVLNTEFTTLVSWLDGAVEANRMKAARKRS